MRCVNSVNIAVLWILLGLAPLLETSLVCTHAWVIGELACANMGKRKELRDKRLQQIAGELGLAYLPDAR